VHAELRPRLSQRALRARQRERMLLRREADERVADLHLTADFDEHFLDDARGFRADFRLIRGQEGPGEIHLALDRHALNGRGADGDGRSAALFALAAGRLGAGGSKCRTNQP
jgi:hypothetical protein